MRLVPRTTCRAEYFPDALEPAASNRDVFVLEDVLDLYAATPALLSRRQQATCATAGQACGCDRIPFKRRPF